MLFAATRLRPRKIVIVVIAWTWQDSQEAKITRIPGIRLLCTTIPPLNNAANLLLVSTVHSATEPAD